MGKLQLAYNIYIEKIIKKFELDKGNIYIPLLFIEFIKFNNKGIITYI